MKSYYDELFQDLDGTHQYFQWIESKIKDTDSIIELACGTGDLLNLFSKRDVLGFDLEASSIQTAIEKYPGLQDKVYVGDFLKKEHPHKKDVGICINDSLNYIQTIEDLERFVDVSLLLADELFLDSHHPYRLIEFEDGYLEEGQTASFDYSYQIMSEDNFLVHIINFLDGRFDSVFQWVFDPMVLKALYEAKGYTVDLFTDFDTQGVSEEGEKVMYHIYKEEAL
ncbi:bifunctional 2-polyprenyl-6-hydroxyphenol methylase/3-demethylubiquinol 3-O-methyltransferase UbiG [Erysipelothrix urinaevulpis]|uniref:class I SAM-dependent methyltransferase n=1 Tax=Erysipelothrix urinaevulpis TaxID=2683717 RepID=UPI00135A017C|nr:class I SAM-dependent methyltransferase [Erysipelothrix urinaevulpis]